MGGVLAIIPARGGSKGIPKKNIKYISGKPLIAYTIDAALKSNVDRLIVSTDDLEIAEIAKSYGAEVPFIRPSEFSEDSSSSLSVIIHALKYLEKEESYIPEIVVFLQPTSPLRGSNHINEGLKMIEESNVESVIGVRRVYEEHPYFMFKVDENRNWVEYEEIENKPARRQDVPPCYLINSALYITKKSYYDNLSSNKYVFNLKSFKGLEMDRISSIDINEISDFYLVQSILDMLENKDELV